MTTETGRHRQSTLDTIVALLVVVFAILVSLFSLRNNDIWWLLGVGRYIAETKAFIYEDPFTFTMSGSPWSPQSYLSAIVFYIIHGAAGAPGLIMLRAVLVAATTAVTLRTLTRVRVSWAVAGALIVLFILIANTRFIVRAHLFEYLFIAILMGFLLTSHERRGRSFFVLPFIVQILWTNMHPSFLLGPALVGLFFAGEWLSARGSRLQSFLRPLQSHDYRRPWILLGLMVVACFVNPNPAAFVLQPMSAEHRELISHFTLEWKSPFDPAIAKGNFHPYYELFLGIALAAVIVSVKRLSVGALLLIVATAYLSLQSHRFRVEFVLVSLPLIAVMVRNSGVTHRIGAGIGRVLRAALVVMAVGLMAFTARDRVEVGESVRARFPDRALDFIAANDVARRPFHTIGYGSYMVWDLYGQRLTFIDGRNFNAGLYTDFLSAQANRRGLEKVIGEYLLDAFVIPSPETSDAGMRNIHKNLRAIGGWSLVHIDDLAWVYVRDSDVSGAFLEAHAYRWYHPDTFGRGQIDQEGLDGVIGDLERAVREAPEYVQLWLDLGLAHSTRGNHDRSIEVLREAVRLAPNNANAWSRLAEAGGTAGRYDVAVEAFARAAELGPGFAPFHAGLARAHAAAGHTPEAAAAYETAIALDPANVDVHVDLIRLHTAGRYWPAALRCADRLAEVAPASHKGHRFAAEALAGLGRTEDAIRRGEQAVEINPRAIDVHMFLANQYVTSGNYPKALERVESVLAVDPDNETALAMRGQLREVLGR